MAESTLSLSYNDFRREVAFLLGWQRDPGNWDNTQRNDFQDISERAQRQFYFPPAEEEDQPTYEWSFLRTAGTLTLVTNTYQYDLPDNFSTILDRSVSGGAGSGIRILKKIPESDIRQLLSLDYRAGAPKYYAVRNKPVDQVNGTRYELLTYPVPSVLYNTVALEYRYVFLPDTIGNTNIYPIGGARYSELMLASYLAAAEYKQDDDPEGPFQKKFDQEMRAAIRADKQLKSNQRGGTA
jgi:hypothetical protein